LATALASAFVLAVGGLASAGGACTSYEIVHCPPADPTAVASYLDYNTIKVDIGTTADTGSINFGLLKTVEGATVDYQESGKELHLRLVADPTAKRITATGAATCEGGIDGTYTLVLQVPPIHQTGDGLTATFQ
jgi:hypothetical protein